MWDDDLGTHGNHLVCFIDGQAFSDAPIWTEIKIQIALIVRKSDNDLMSEFLEYGVRLGGLFSLLQYCVEVAMSVAVFTSIKPTKADLEEKQNGWPSPSSSLEDGCSTEARDRALVPRYFLPVIHPAMNE